VVRHEPPDRLAGGRRPIDGVYPGEAEVAHLRSLPE
jgi:hypothetical protein